jgi:hypothetical protein|tara:strand:- start:1153 stop:1419 length:267 start_codon:yes stop_codon:yes gene_type:complete
MNKKGQTVFVGIMVAIMVFITLVVLITPLKEAVTIGRDSDHLDCGNQNITTGQKATCILVDLWLFYFVGVAMAGGIGFITGRRIQQRI